MLPHLLAELLGKQDEQVSGPGRVDSAGPAVGDVKLRG